MIHPIMTTHPIVNRGGVDVSEGPDDGVDDALLRLLADPLRARLITLLAREQLCTCHLADATGSLPTAVSNHLRRLRHEGVVERESAGRYTYYRLAPEALERLGLQLLRLAEAARQAPKRPC